MTLHWNSKPSKLLEKFDISTRVTRYFTDTEHRIPATVMKRLLFQIIKVCCLLILPFVALIRTAVYLIETYHLSPYPALVGGIFSSALFIFIYIVYIQQRMSGALGDFRNMRRVYWIATALVLAYCLPGLFYISSANTKHRQVAEEFTSLHPILRLGISTLVFLDKSLILTDASRLPEDYKKMGLKTKRHSLHYTQSTGYAHAVDIRTNGHGELRNGLIKVYFKMMGFNTLRHVGTDDHLHVSISSPDRKGGI